jgi:3-hydroxyisobutyrate dehydrogenase-like beta-hydroxyacid dehydrogenase
MKVALIGYGEVGRILAEDLRAADHLVTAFDAKLTSEARDPLVKHARSCGVKLAESHAEAVRDAGLTVSAVTASQTVAVALSCSSAIKPQGYFLDLNSASPGAKITAAGLVESAGGRYVEGAVMTSVPPYRIKVPLFVGGPHAPSVLPMLHQLGFAAVMASQTMGVTSATKMCRSVMIKGLEALLIESFSAARHYGVEQEVIASLRETLPGVDWEKQAAYFFQRVIEHGRRRAEEMREVANTVRDAGIEPFCASATAERQAWVADLADTGAFGERDGDGFARSPDWRTEADRLLSHVKSARK